MSLLPEVGVLLDFFYMGWMCWVNVKKWQWWQAKHLSHCKAVFSNCSLLKSYAHRRATKSTIIGKKPHLYCGISTAISNMKCIVPPAKTYIESGEIIKSKLDLLINITYRWCTQWSTIPIIIKTLQFPMCVYEINTHKIKTLKAENLRHL